MARQCPLTEEFLTRLSAYPVPTMGQDVKSGHIFVLPFKGGTFFKETPICKMMKLCFRHSLDTCHHAYYMNCKFKKWTSLRCHLTPMSPIIMKIEGFDKWLWKHVSTTIKNKLGWVMSEFSFGLVEFPALFWHKKSVFSKIRSIVNICLNFWSNLKMTNR